VISALALAVAGALAGAEAQSPPHVKVHIDFKQTARSARDTAAAGGRVVITERSTRVRPRVEVGSSDTRTTHSSGVFTVVRSGGEATITLAQQVPYTEVAFYQDYATGQGYVTHGVLFRDVGTSLKVNATVLDSRQISVRVTPVISYFSPDRTGTIELTRASTDLLVRPGEPVVIAGGTKETNSVTRRILGLSERAESSETVVVLTATIFPY
jgi:hypothetical protein